MPDDQFDSWLRRVAPTYNAPPTPDVDGMWADIEPHLTTAPSVRPRTTWWTSQWLRAAALLAIGVSLGRVSVTPTVPPRVAATPLVEVALSDAASGLSALSGPATDEYLGQTVALLASLQNDAISSPSNARKDGLTERASALLSTTRFLLDAPSGDDPRVRALLEDLELVLVQVVQMPAARSTTDVDHIHQAMAERDVMPRLRTAVANIHSAD